MAWSPIAFTTPNYRDYKNWWLKAYIPATTTPKSLSLDSDGSTLVAKLELNKDGFPVSSGGALVIPYINGNYDLWAFPTEADADANDTTNALRFADNLSGAISEDNVNEAIAGQKPTFNFETLSDAQSSTDTDKIFIGSTLYIKERTTGNGGGAMWDAVSSTTYPANSIDVVTTGSAGVNLKQRRQGSFDVEIPSEFPDLQSAVDFYMSSQVYADKFIDLWIADGHLLTKGLGCFHGDFSRFRIRSRNDAIVKLDPAFVGVSTSGVPAGVLGEAPNDPLMLGFDCIMPQLWCIIDMENDATLGTGIQLAEAEMFVNEGGGVINAGFRGIQVHGRANIYGANFSGANGSGVRLQQASSANARNVVADNCCQSADLTNGAIYVSRSSTLEFRGGSAQNSGASGLVARRAIITADEANFSGAADKGIEAETCAQVSFTNGTALNCVSNAIRSISNASVYAVGVQSSTTSSADNFNVDVGGVITVAGSNTVEGIPNTEAQTIAESNVAYTNSFDGANGMIFFDDANGTFKITSNADGISQRFADGRMITFSGFKSLDTGVLASGTFSGQLTFPNLPDTFVQNDGSFVQVVGRTSAGGGGNRVAVDSYHRGLGTGNEWKIRNTGEQLDGAGTGLNVQSINYYIVTYGTWR